MNRREVIATAGFVLSPPLAGCGQGVGGSTPTSRRTATPIVCDALSDGDRSENEPSKDFPFVRVDSDETEIEDVQIAVVIRRHFDDEAPAQLRIIFLNSGDEKRSFKFGDIEPFSGLKGHHVDSEDALYIDPGSEIDPSMPPDARPEEPSNGCWEVEHAPSPNDVVRGASLEPCESLTNEYDIYSHPNTPNCLAVGEYRFEAGTTGAYTHKWGFSLHLEYR